MISGSRTSNARRGRPVAAETVRLRDAIPPDRLRELVENEITNRIDPQAWNLARQHETEERDLLHRIAAGGTA